MGALADMATSKKKPPLGSGARFKAIERSAHDADDPAAVAAAAGMKKWGKGKMAALAAAGRKRG